MRMCVCVCALAKKFVDHLFIYFNEIEVIKDVSQMD